MREQGVKASSSAESPTRPRVLVVADEVLPRVRLTIMLEEGGFQVAAVASAKEALEVLDGLPGIEAVVTDVGLSSEDQDGYGLAHEARKRWGIGVVVIAGQGSPSADQLAPGIPFLAKPIHGATLVHLVHSVMADLAREQAAAPMTACQATVLETFGENEKLLQLSPRQREVLELMVQSKSNKDIAQVLGLSEHTVRVHVAAIFRKLGVSKRVEAVVVGLRCLEVKASKSPETAMGERPQV
jgi:DNA-binding NarL/FixJ family response regulator